MRRLLRVGCCGWAALRQVGCSSRELARGLSLAQGLLPLLLLLRTTSGCSNGPGLGQRALVDPL